MLSQIKTSFYTKKKPHSFFTCKSIKVCKFINEFDTERMVSKCSVVIILVESHEDPVGDGVSISVTFSDVGDGDDEASFFKLSSLSPKLIKLSDFGVGSCFAGDGKLKTLERFAGNMTNMWLPRDIRPKATGYLGFCSLSLSLNKLSSI